MSSWSQEFVVLIGKILPEKIQRFLYLLPVLILRWRLFSVKKLNGQLWYRNSLFFGDVVFGYSDIDLTFYSSVELSEKERKQLMGEYHFWKKIFPHLGELVVYDKKSLRKFLPFANGIELKRDPLLLETLEKTYEDFKDEVPLSDKMAFALNWIKSDHHKLETNYPLRFKKVRRFLTLLEIPELENLPENTESLLDYLHQNIWYQLSQISKEEKAFESFMRDLFSRNWHDPETLNSFYIENPHYHLWFLTCYPQLWLGPATITKCRKKDIEELQNAPRLFFDVFKAQIHWEVWGLYGQWFGEWGDINFVLHVEGVIELLSHFPEDFSEALSLLKVVKESGDDFIAREAKYVS